MKGKSHPPCPPGAWSGTNLPSLPVSRSPCENPAQHGMDSRNNPAHMQKSARFLTEPYRVPPLDGIPCRDQAPPFQLNTAIQPGLQLARRTHPYQVPIPYGQTARQEYPINPPCNNYRTNIPVLQGGFLFIYYEFLIMQGIVYSILGA